MQAHTQDGPVYVDPQDFHDTVNFLARINEEVIRQDELWGEQNHPVRCRVFGWEHKLNYDYEASKLKRHNDDAAKHGALSWDTILLEEVYEALSERDPEKTITELVQVAAVALSAAKSIRRSGMQGAL